MDLQNAIQEPSGLWGARGDLDAFYQKQRVKALLLSDSHYNREVVSHILAAEGNVDILLFTGDGVGDIIELCYELPPVVAFVRGNNDSSSYPFAFADTVSLIKIPRYITLDIAGFKVCMTHGDVFSFFDPVTDSLAFAKENGVDVILSGHTHRAACEYKDGVLSLNAGSVARPRGCPASFCTITFKKGDSRPDYIFYKIESKERNEPFVYRPFIPKQFTNDWLL